MIYYLLKLDLCCSDTKPIPLGFAWVNTRLSNGTVGIDKRFEKHIKNE